MIALITSIIPAEWLAGLAALLAAFVGVWITGRRSGAVRAGNQATEAAAKRREAGRKGEAAAKADMTAGKTPEEIVRANDGAWR